MPKSLLANHRWKTVRKWIKEKCCFKRQQVTKFKTWSNMPKILAQYCIHTKLSKHRNIDIIWYLVCVTLLQFDCSHSSKCPSFHLCEDYIWNMTQSVCSGCLQEERKVQVFLLLKSSLWHLRDNWRCIFFLLAASLPAALHSPRSDPACSAEVLFTRLSSERSHLESEQRMKEIRWRSCQPSRCLDQDTSLTFNSV